MVPRLFFAAALLLATTVADTGGKLELDDVLVTFTLGAVAHTVEGSIPVASSDLRIDLQTGALAGEIVLDARGADTGSRRRDRKMHEDVLRSQEHPEITFRPKRFEGEVPETGTAEGTLHGTIRLVGEEHDVAMTTRLERSGDALRLDADLRVPYVEWGLEDPSVFLLRVDKHVDVRIEGTLRLAEGVATADPR